MLNFIRIAKVVALLAFVLPWVAVSCQGVDLATASGVDLIQGKLHANPEATKQLGAQFGDFGGASVEEPTASETTDLGMNYFALATAAAIALGLALTFIGAAKTAARNAVVTSLLAAALSYGAIWQFKEAVKSENADQEAPAADNPFGTRAAGLGDDIINGMLQERYGYWIVLGALIVAAGAGALGVASPNARARNEPAA